MRVQRYVAVFLITLVFPALLWAATASEMLSITSATPVGITSTLCSYGPTQAPAEHGALIQILDQPVYFTLHGSAAVPSATLGGLAPAGTIITVDRASDFKAIAVSTTSRAYVVCVPSS
jgi:hypothetical protein